MMTYCPICGAGVKSGSELIACGFPNPSQHRCRQKVLDCIDGALSSDEPRIREPSLNQRLTEGFSMLNGEEET